MTKNGKNGLLVPVDNVDEMAKAIMSIIESEELSNRLSLTGGEILSELSPQVINSKWVAAFKQILG